MTAQDAIRLLLEKYNAAAVRGAQSVEDKEILDSPASVFNRDPMIWVNNVFLGLDPSFRQDGGEYSLETAIKVGEFLREACSAGLAEFDYAGIEYISRMHVQRIRDDYVPLENVVDEAMEGLKLEGTIRLQMQEQLKNDLSGSAGVMHVWDFATGNEVLYVNWRASDGMLRTAKGMLMTAKRVVGERAAKPLYMQGDYDAVQQLFHGIDGKRDAELWFIRVSSNYRLALEVPTSNRKRHLSLGSLKKTITSYIKFLQKHPQGTPGMKAELNEDFKKGEEFAAQLRQQNQPKDYVKRVEAIFGELKNYAPPEQRHE